MGHPKKSKNEERKTVIFAAIGANLAVVIVKSIAAFFTGSSAMLSEAIHSAVDTGNEILLLIGVNRSHKRADALHPFGYGKELYFWSFIVALFVFAFGGGLSTYEGIQHILHPEPMQNALWNYAILGSSMIFEGISFRIGLKKFRTGRGHRFLSRIQASKDPSIFTVLMEDLAAITGLIIAAVGIALSQFFARPEIDGIASVAIGVLLVGVAFVLARECRDLLIGESLAPKALNEIREIIATAPEVRQVYEILSMHLAPGDVLLNIRLRFRSEITRDQIAQTSKSLVQRIRAVHPEVHKVFFASDSFVQI